MKFERKGNMWMHVCYYTSEVSLFIILRDYLWHCLNNISIKSVSSKEEEEEMHFHQNFPN